MTFADWLGHWMDCHDDSSWVVRSGSARKSDLCIDLDCRYLYTPQVVHTVRLARRQVLSTGIAGGGLSRSGSLGKPVD